MSGFCLLLLLLLADVFLSVCHRVFPFRSYQVKGVSFFSFQSSDVCLPPSVCSVVHSIYLSFSETQIFSTRIKLLKMGSISKDEAKVHQYIEENQVKFINNLKESVEIASVSCWAANRKDCFRMVDWTEAKLKALGCTTEIRQQDYHEVEGQKVQLPPILLAQLGNDPNKLTILIYGHLDVQPAKVSDGWDYEPFTLTETENGNLYGRGSTDDKGPVLGWVHAIEAFQKSGVDIPVNLKFVFECMEECGSEGLEETLHAIKDTFLKGVDAVTISDNYWLGTDTPCLTYGLRGLCYFFVEVECGTKDLHSGVFGGAVHEAMPDLMWIMNQLVDVKGKILIPGAAECRALDANETKIYDDIPFDLEKFKEESGVHGLIHSKSKNSTLMARWRYPALSIHGIEGAFADPGSKTVIPRKVIGKFSIRLVPDQDPAKIDKLVKNYLEAKWAERGSPNKLKVSSGHSGKPWLADHKHPNFVAAANATKRVYGQTPLLTREGGSIPITLIFEEITKKNVMLLPMGQSNDGAHSQNEKLNKRNYIVGTKLFASYLLDLGGADAKSFA